MKSKIAILFGVIFLLSVSFANAQSDNNAKDLYFGYKPKPERRQQTTVERTRTTVESRTTTTVRTNSRNNSNNRTASNSRNNSSRQRASNRNRVDNPAANNANSSNGSSGVSPSLTGLPGTKITIELMRKGKLSFVKPTFAFRSGDKIRLRMKTNFEGYATVLNLGSSGNVNLLYPVQGRDNFVKPTGSYQIPQGDGWIVFDDESGTEIISVILSENKLQNLADLDRNSDYFTKERTSKDLFVQTSGNDLYAVFNELTSSENVGFTLKLKHKN